MLFGFYGGVNFSYPGIIKSFDILSHAGDAIPGAKSYNNILKNRGFQVGAIGYLKLNEHLALSCWPGFASYNFYYSIFNNWADSISLQNSAYSFTNRYRSINLPVEFSWIFNPDDKLNYFVSAGIKYEFIFGSSKKLDYFEEMIENNTVTGVYRETFKSDENRLFVRNHFQVQAGTGISYNFPRFTLLAEINFLKGLNNITRKSGRMADPGNIYTFPDIQDDLFMNNITINIALLYKLFKAPKKLKCVTP
ncbi:MAG: PorT family protein [Bacteroidales bacterium]|nr:PorT family protein [Bacteroidales bacterium]